MNSTFSHEPKDYVCPFCAFLGGRENEYNTKQDIVYRNDYVTAFIAPRWWINNVGHALVIPNKHFENLYTIPDDLLAEVYKAAKKIAVAMRSTYQCDGISTRQHNEPSGGQDVWHVHVHVFPRYDGDNLYQNTDQNRFAGPAERAPFAEKLRAYFAKNPS